MSSLNEKEKNTEPEVKQRSLIRQIIIIIGAGLILYTVCLIIGVNKASEIGFDRYFQTLLDERIEFFQKEITKRTVASKTIWTKFLLALLFWSVSSDIYILRSHF